MIAYFDSSALLKLLVEEPGSQDAAALWDAADIVVSSRMAFPEVRAALSAAHRARRLTDDDLRAAKGLWSDFWDGLRAIELTPDLAHDAGELAEAHALSGFDAVHLASALLLADDQPIIATWDGRLLAAARNEHLTTLPGTM